MRGEALVVAANGRPKPADSAMIRPSSRKNSTAGEEIRGIAKGLRGPKLGVRHMICEAASNLQKVIRSCMDIYDSESHTRTGRLILAFIQFMSAHDPALPG